MGDYHEKIIADLMQQSQANDSTFGQSMPDDLHIKNVNSTGHELVDAAVAEAVIVSL